MSDEEAIAGALSDPDNPPITPEQAARFRRVAPVKALRQRIGLSQQEFADAIGIPLGTLRDWEQHRSQPEGAASALLRAIEREPDTMLRLLKAA